MTNFILFVATDGPISLKTFQARQAEIQRHYPEASVTFTPQTFSNVVVALESEEPIETLRQDIVKGILQGAELAAVIRDGVLHPVEDGMVKMFSVPNGATVH